MPLELKARSEAPKIPNKNSAKTRIRKGHNGALGGNREMWILLLPALIPVLVLSVFPRVQGTVPASTNETRS